MSGLHDALKTATGIQSGPNGSGRMKVVIDGLEPGAEFVLHSLLSAALTTPSQGLDAATVRHCAGMVRDRAVTISASSLNGTPASDASKIAARHLIRAAEDMERALATEPHQHGGKGA